MNIYIYKTFNTYNTHTTICRYGMMEHFTMNKKKTESNEETQNKNPKKKLLVI